MTDRENGGQEESLNRKLAELAWVLQETQLKITELSGGKIDPRPSQSEKGETELESFKRHLLEQKRARKADAEMMAGILDALPAHVAVLDEEGYIVEINEAWKKFGHANHLLSSSMGIGTNYISLCEAVTGEEKGDALAVAEGIRAVINGSKVNFVLEYPCHTPARKHWFQMTVTPLGKGTRGVVIMHTDITERVVSEQKNREFAQKYHMLFVNHPHPMWVYDLDTLEILAVNNVALHEYGYTEEEFLGMTLEDLHPEGQLTALHENISKVSEGIDKAGVWLHKTKDGRVIYVEVTSHTSTFEGRRTEFASAVNVTERIKAENALRESENRFRMVLEDVPDVGIQGYTPEGTIFYWNRASEQIYGYTSEEAIGKNLFDLLIPSELRATVRERTRVALANGGIIPPEEWELLHKDGSRISLYTSHAIVRRPGHPPELFDMDVDLSLRNELQRRIAQSEQRLNLVMKATVDSIYDWNLTAGNVWWNDAFYEHFGHDPQTVPRGIESWSNNIHPEDREMVISSIDRAVEGHGEEWEERYRFLKADGTHAWVIDRGFVARDEEGRAVRMVGGIRDITKEVALEEQLRQSQRLEAVGHLTGGLAHDFNNLLTVVLGNTELLLEELDAGNRLRPLVEMIFQATERGSELTHRLLAFARRQALDPKVIDVSQLVSSMDSMLRRTLGEHIEIELIRGAGLWRVQVDPSQLESAILNLCINSRDAMLHGGKLTIETANVSINTEYADRNLEVSPGQYVLIAVSDTGDGIPREIIERVFEPFFTTKGEGKGTGLGMSMVYGFVKQSKGHIKVYSEPGEGTVVRIYLPRALGEVVEEIPSTKHSRPLGGNEVILLVEDDELVRHFAEFQLISLGYLVFVASNGPEALDVLQQHPEIDLLFTDIVMPGGMNGRQLADRAKELRPDLKVLYTSGYTDNAIVHHGRLDPGAKLLGKPYGKAELARKIREVLGES
ncbi:MAG: PAS domain S-box protein [Candidatus Sumerlaeia bacterium]|nr:PAS domain S-box protein [Candidatus Sumerlaeia bacterium]